MCSEKAFYVHSTHHSALKRVLPFSRPRLSIGVEELLPVLTNFVSAWHPIEKFDDRFTHAPDDRSYLFSVQEFC